ncbi:HD-GYP domain-containing protein [Aquabacterium parvum]|uniref:HD-GYP domain-containing protein n=1 Tax=Aquabacterium parvum TaxID=70584 RepID=UPI000718DACC|nr:HD-GYP domain-containing protein [Aquabacterium parvum]MBU0917981.1 HD-GYP domain-containing protein [Gammaproteobacteria bacterium]
MLRKISPAQLRLGMFVHEVPGSWLSHPFWRGAFKVVEDKQLAQLREAVAYVVIDTAKGLDIEEAQPAEPVAEAPPERGAPPPVAPAEGGPEQGAKPTAGQPAAGFQDEVRRASKIVAQARPAMKNLFRDVRLGKAIDTEHCLPLVSDIADSVERNPAAIVSLARLKTSDDYTFMHSVAVCALMVALGKQLGLGEADCREAGLAGLVHDLGKALMPLEVLNKPGALTSEEFAIMKSHPEAGHRMLLEGKGVGPVPLDVCLHHHEKVNGKGYPHGLQGDEISLFAKMGAVCDVYDAITSNRPYKAGWDPAESITKMAQWAKEGHFDEKVFQAFVKSVGIYPVGSLVKLKSGRLAIVVEQGSSSLLKPVVKVFYSTRANEPLVPEVLDLGRVSDEIVSREAPSTWGFKNLDDFWLPQGAA